mgnify:CR=1 FL=1
MKKTMCLYYHDSGAGEEVYDGCYDEKNTKEQNEDNWEQRGAELKSMFGEIATGAEDLYIDLDTDKPGLIQVGNSVYKLIEPT